MNIITRKTASALLAFCTMLIVSFPGAEGKNSIATGAKTEIADPVDIPIHPPADFNFKTKWEVLDQRTECVMEHKELLGSAYTPDEDVFGQIEDGRPWWGTLGMGYYGSGMDSIKGEATHSNFILNPYLLVGIHTSEAIPKNVPESAIQSLKLYCVPQFLKWWPKASKLQVAYNMTDLVQEYTGANVRWSSPYKFSLQACNARDLGFKYAFIPLDNCANIQCNAPSANPFSIPQYYHCGGSCGYPGGCNNQSPWCPALEFGCTELPARIVVWLYRNDPQSPTKLPDFVCYVDLI